MAREFKLLFLLLFVVAFNVSVETSPGDTAGSSPTAPAAASTGSGGSPTTKPPATTTGSGGSPTTKPPATTTGSGGSPTTKPPATTTGTGGSPTTKPPATTTGSGGSPTTKPPATTTGSDGSPTTKPPATTTGSGGSPTTKPPATTTGSGGSPTTKPPATTTGSGGSPTTKPPATTTGSGGSPTTKPPATTTGTGGSPTTKPPATTTGSGGSPTTKPTATTTGSGGSPTTKPPATTTGTGGSPTTKPPATTTGTGGSPTTKPPATTTGSGGVSTTTAVSATTKPQGPCDPSQCGRGSTCEPRANQTFVCLCLAGDYYNYISKSCESAKVFPGQLGLPEINYSDDMANNTSTQFQTASQEIAAALTAVFKNSDGYTESTVLKLRPIEESTFRSMSKKGVKASVEIIFKTNSNIKLSDIEEQITTASKCEDGCFLGNANFTETDLCIKNPCDETTTTCSSENGSFNCPCKEDYIQIDFSSRICMACPSGQKASGSECVDCPFGYSGLNCNESWQLVLVIVGSVLGGLLLITIILLPIVASKSSKKSSKKTKKNKHTDISDPYVSHFPAKAPLVNSNLANIRAPSVNGGSTTGLAGFANAGAPRIPRATTTSSWDRGTNLEMTPSSSRQNLIPVGRNERHYDDPDDSNFYAQNRPQSDAYAQNRPQSDPYAQNRPQSNLYAQNRPQSNPYAQNRPQINPYAPSQGQTNAYYVHDDGRRFN